MAGVSGNVQVNERFDFLAVGIMKIAASQVFNFGCGRMAFTKSHDGSRAFFHTDQGRIFARAGKAWQPEQTNGRLRSAVRILVDLGLLESDAAIEGCIRRTAEGSAFLNSELAALART